MIIIQNTVISDDVRDNFFVCNLEACKGACCVEGDLGAPLEEAERQILEQEYANIAPSLTEAGRAAIEQQGPLHQGLGGRLQHPDHQRPGVRLRSLRRARPAQVRHRAGLPGRGHELQEAHQLPPLPDSHQQVRRLRGPELRPLGHLLARLRLRRQPGRARLPVPQRAADSQVRGSVVWGAGGGNGRWAGLVGQAK